MKCYDSANWKKLQLRFLKADDISCDYKLKQFMLDNSSWIFDLEHASADIKNFAQENNINQSTAHCDFFMINDMEFGKIPLRSIETHIKNRFNNSEHGGYFAMQSYYFNWTNDQQCCYADLSDSMDLAVQQWVEKYLNITTYDNDSLAIDNPLENRDADGVLLSGSDFMYTHGNTRFWLWKKS